MEKSKRNTLNGTYVSEFDNFPNLRSQNPFITYADLNFNATKIIWLIIMSVFVVPLRLFLISVLLSVANVLAIIILWNVKNDDDEPLEGWRKHGKNLASKIVIWAHEIGGVKWEVKGKPALPTEAPIVVLAPHTSYLDALPYCVTGALSLVVRSTLRDVPSYGRLLMLSRSIFVTRESAHSRQYVIELIQRRAKRILDEPRRNWQQIVVFPEGTCTNRTSLIQFKLGAFLPGLPVQPVALHWKGDKDYGSWSWESSHLFVLIWLMLCQWKTCIEIEYLPVYAPSEAEKVDAALFANNVRLLFAGCLKLPVSNFSIDDTLVCTSISKPAIKRFWSICKKLGLWQTDNMEIIESNRACLMLNYFEKMRQSKTFTKNYHVTVAMMSEMLDLTNGTTENDSVQRLFNMFDYRFRSVIDFRSLIVTRFARRDQSRMSREFLHASFAMLVDNIDCVNDEQKLNRMAIDEEGLMTLLRFPLRMSVKEVQKLGWSLRRQPVIGDSDADDSNLYRVRLENLENWLNDRQLLIK